MNSFELVFCVIAGDVIIDREYYNMKEAQCIRISFTFCLYFVFVIIFHFSFYFLVKQVFSDMDFLGWYTTGDTPTEKDIEIHRQICEINESPILLQLNPNGKSGDVCRLFSKTKISHLRTKTKR